MNTTFVDPQMRPGKRRGLLDKFVDGLSNAPRVLGALMLGPPFST